MINLFKGDIFVRYWPSTSRDEGLRTGGREVVRKKYSRRYWSAIGQQYGRLNIRFDDKWVKKI